MTKLSDSVLGRRPSQNLYHYTTQTGFLGIVTSKSLWASKVHYMNDATEFAHAIGIAKSVIESRASNGSNDRVRLLDELRKRLDSVSKTHMFVACLSEAGDLLSQWRGYCSGGNGFSIGFSPERLLPVLSRQGFGIAACVYDSGEQYRLLEELVDDAIEAISRSVSHEEVLGTFISRFLRIGPLLKHPLFSEEKEWRILCGIIATDDARFQIRGGKSMLVPYCEVNLCDQLGTMHVEDLIIGPTPSPELSAASATNLLSRYGVAWINCGPSKVPYRLW